MALRRLIRLLRDRKESERGAALISAIFIVALMATVAAAATEEIRYAIRRTANLEARDQAYWYALGAEQLARARLSAAQDETARALLERAAAQGRTLGFPIDGGTIVATLRDAQNCFNLNSVVERSEGGLVAREAGIAEYARVLAGAGVRGARAQSLANALADWIDSDMRPRSGGAEDGVYLAGPAPHRAANTLIAEVEELRAIEGYDEEIFTALRPLVCAGAGPDPAGLNVDTLTPARAPLLSALYGPELTLAEAEDVIAARPAAGWGRVEAFLAHPRIAEIAASDEVRGRLSLHSTQFVLLTEVDYLGADFRLESALSAPLNGVVRTRSRRFGAVQ